MAKRVFEGGSITEEWIWNDLLARRRERLNALGYDAYCLFCKTGLEIAAARELNQRNECVLAVPFLRLMHKSRNGVRTLVQEALFKGYLFAFIPLNMDLARVDKGKSVYGVLGAGSGAAALGGSDLEYAEWVLSIGGLVDVSRAVRVNDRVKIVSGPLLNLEGCIKEYSKKNRNCRVQIDFVGQQISAWLPFDWVENAAGPLDFVR